MKTPNIYDLLLPPCPPVSFPIQLSQSPKALLYDIPVLLLNAEADFRLEEDALELAAIISGRPVPAKDVVEESSSSNTNSSSGSNSSSSRSSSRKKAMIFHEVIKGTNHMSIIVGVGNEEDLTTKKIINFMQSHR